MKRYFFLLLAATSCTDFLDTTMKSDYAAENFYTSQDAALMAVTGVYSSLYGTQWYIFGDVASDDSEKGGNPGDNADVNDINGFSASPDNGVIITFWTKTYETIAQANNVIAYVQEMDIPLRDRLLGEAKFIRAFSYFWLTNIFGSVPYKDKPQLTAAAIHVGLSAPDVIYAAIEADLIAAAAALPFSYAAADKGRVTQGAALAMLAKVYLFQKKYDLCLKAIADLEDLQQYTLLHTYSNLFRSGAEDSTEVIFGLRFRNTTEATLGNAFAVWMAPLVEGGYNFNAPTQSFVDCFTEPTTAATDDPRLDASLGRHGMPWFNGLTFDEEWSATGYLVKKYNEENPLKQPIGYFTVPYHYLRYADVLLMKAEALNETSAANAVAELNRVRLRASLSALPTSILQPDLRASIRTERRRELGFEFHRFFDLMRYGQSAAEAALQGTGFVWQEPRFYFPIPQMEADANQAL
jgi:hypothetical protein